MSQETNDFLIEKMQSDADIVAIMVDVQNLITVSDPYDRSPLLDTQPAQIVVRPEAENPDTFNSQGGVKNETIFIEIRSWDRQKVNDLKKRVHAVLDDASGLIAGGGRIYRVRYDWGRAPYLNPDGKTFESQVRYIVAYRDN
jgi:hypothetical protein